MQDLVLAEHIMDTDWINLNLIHVLPAYVCMYFEAAKPAPGYT